ASTGRALSAARRGQLRGPTRWSLLSLPTLSLGQEVSVTALQMVAAFGAIANGGTLMQPRLVRATFDADGREARRFQPLAVRQVVSPATARTLTRILVKAVEAGTGHNAAIPGYEVAGKTGTAQKLDPTTGRYSRAPGVLSFVGWAPADEPRFEGYRNFANKLWNAARLVLSNLDGYDAAKARKVEPTLADRWIQSRLTATIGVVRTSLRRYRFNDAASAVYQFLWHEYCDWYLEIAKLSLYHAETPAQRLGTQHTLARVLETTLRLLHPF